MPITSHTKDYELILGPAKNAYKKASTTEQKQHIIINAITEILNDWTAYGLDASALRIILTFAFNLPKPLLTNLLNPLLTPDYTTEDLDIEKILLTLLTVTKKCKNAVPVEQKELEQHFILTYCKENNNDDLFKEAMVDTLSKPLYSVFDRLLEAYSQDQKTENAEPLKLFSISILKSAIKHGNAVIVTALYSTIQCLDFYNEILNSFSAAQKETLLLLSNVQSPHLVTEVLQEYSFGEFGRISPASARLDLACRAARKTYSMQNITVLEDTLTSYLSALKTANYPLSEYFILTGYHWTSGYIEVDKKGNSKILLLDSLGYTPNRPNMTPYYPETKNILKDLHGFKPDKNASVEIYFSHYQRQFSATGCRVYALNDIGHLPTLTQYMPEPYKGNSIFNYLKNHIHPQFTDSTLPKINFVDLPLSLMRSAQTSQPERFLSQQKEEASWAVNKKGETAEISIQNSMKPNAAGKKQNNHIKIKLEKKHAAILAFLSEKSPHSIPALQYPYTLDAMIKRVTALTLLTPAEWDAANPGERLQQLQDIFKKLHIKANRLEISILESEIKKYAELAFLYLTPRQIKSVFETILSKKDYLDPISTSALFAIILILCSKKEAYTNIADYLLEIYLNKHSAEALLLDTQNTASEKYLEDALQRFVKNTKSEKTLTIIAALILYTIKTYHAELCIKLSSRPFVLPKSKKQIQQKLLSAIDPEFVTKFMRAYQMGSFGDIGSIQALATLAQYAEKYPSQATNTTLLKSKKEITAYFEDLAQDAAITTEYFIIVDNNHWITGIFHRMENGDTNLFISDATGRNAQGGFSQTVQKTVYAFGRFFKTNDHNTHTTYIAETVRHTDTCASWVFALRDLKNLFTLKALPKSSRTQGIFYYLAQHPANTTYKTAGLDFKIIELPPRLAALSIKVPGHQKYNRAARVVKAYKQEHAPHETFLLYKVIRLAQKILGFIVDKTPEILESHSFKHTLAGCLERHQVLRFSQSSLASSASTETVFAKDRSLSISV